MNQSKTYGIKNPKWICLLKPLRAQSCQRSTTQSCQRGSHNDVTATIVRVSWNFRKYSDVSWEKWEKDEEKFKNIFSRTQKYLTCPASCEGEWEYGLLKKHMMAGCFEMIGKFWKSVWVFRRQIQIFLRQGLLKRQVSSRATRAANDKCSRADTSTFAWHVQTAV